MTWFTDWLLDSRGERIWDFDRRMCRCHYCWLPAAPWSLWAAETTASGDVHTSPQSTRVIIVSLSLNCLWRFFLLWSCAFCDFVPLLLSLTFIRWSSLKFPIPCPSQHENLSEMIFALLCKLLHLLSYAAS